MILDPKAEKYITPKEPTMGLLDDNHPYIGFTYPKTEEQISTELQEKIKQKIKNPQVKEYFNCILTIDKNKYKIYTDKDKLFQSQNYRYELTPQDKTISITRIKQIIEKKESELNVKKIHESIISEIKKYVYLSREEEYYIIATYIMLTYKYQHFDFMPILHLSGDAGTGKSQIGKICIKLGFNSSATVSTTKSSFFRRIDRKRGLYFMDEKEQLEEYEKELLNGCTYEGNIHTISEKIGDNYKDHDFQIYTPIMLACINEIYGATSTRTIKIETIKPPRKNKKYPVIRLTQDTTTWESIRDDLAEWSIRTFKENKKLMEVDEELEGLLSNRGIDAWKLIYNQLKILGQESLIKKYLIDYYVEQQEDNYFNDINYQFLIYLNKFKNAGWVSAQELYNEFTKDKSEQEKQYFNKTRFGKLMRKIGYSERELNKRRSSTGNEYLLNENITIKYLINNYDYIEEKQEIREQLVEEVQIKWTYQYTAKIVKKM